MAAVPKIPSAPPALSTQAEALVTAFGARPDVNADQLTNFRAAVNASPSIIQQLNSAVASGQLTEIRPLPLGTNVGGQFVPGASAMEVPLQIMTTPSGGRFNPAELTYVLGHEVQHSINQPGLVASRTDFASGNASAPVASRKGWDWLTAKVFSAMAKQTVSASGFTDGNRARNSSCVFSLAGSEQLTKSRMDPKSRVFPLRASTW